MNRLNLQERREKNRDRIHNSKSATAKKKLNRLNLQERRERNRDRIRNSKSATAKKKLVSAIAICVSRGLFTKVDQTIVKVAIPRYNKTKPRGDLEFLLDALVKVDALVAKNAFDFSVLKTKNIQDLLKNGFTYVDNFLPKDLVNRVLHEIETNTKIVWKHPYNHGRDDIITWLKPFDDICTADADSNNALNELMMKYVLNYLHSDLVQLFHIKSDITKFEHQLACYSGPYATGYAMHRDSSRNESLDNNGRKLTCIAYIQDDNYRPEDGGQLLLFKDERPIRESSALEIDPIGGRLLIFFSGAIDHAVRPFRSKKRIAFTTWFS
eukprot:g3315.t1